MLEERITYGYDDICIVPSVVSSIDDPKKCNTRKDGMLPIFAAPMRGVIDLDNYMVYSDRGIIPTIPIYIDTSERDKLLKEGLFVAYSLDEFTEFVNTHKKLDFIPHIIIDGENGNSEKMFKVSSDAKDRFGKDNIVLMAGNIANYLTYKEYCRAGIDYVRVGLSVNNPRDNSMHVGIASLINDVHKEKKTVESDIESIFTSYKCVTKIIAEGGLRKFEDIIKAFALGADYIMTECRLNTNILYIPIEEYLSSVMSSCNIEDINDFNPENVNTMLISNNVQKEIYA